MLSRMVCFFFFQAEDGIRDLVRSRGLGDVYKRQGFILPNNTFVQMCFQFEQLLHFAFKQFGYWYASPCLLYTSDAADERSSVDLGGRRIIKKKKIKNGSVTGSV